MYVFVCERERGKERGRGGEDVEGNEEEHSDKDSDYVQYVTRKSVCLFPISVSFHHTVITLVFHVVLFFL